MMSSASVLTFVLFLSSTLVSFTVAQFPVACTDTTSLTNKVCCPDPGNGAGVCGESNNRGTCTDILGSTSSQNNQSHRVVRDRWPYYFRRACKCNGNYAGFDCSRCKYGYYGENCQQKTIKERRDISEFMDADWLSYTNILNMTRNYDSDYFVFTQEPQGDDNYSSVDLTTLERTGNLKLYNLFVWQHHYVAKDNVIKGDTRRGKLNSQIIDATRTSRRAVRKHAHAI